MAEWEEKLGAILNDPQAMSQIMSIAQSISGGQAREDAPHEAEDAAPDAPAPVELPPAPGLDPRLMEAGMRALSAYQDPHNTKVSLLLALKPFLREERRGKVDRAVQIARLSKVVRAALDGLGGGEGDV